MTKSYEEKHFDVRTMDRYLQKGAISQSDIKEHMDALPNDEENFELIMIEDDDIGLGDTLTDEEIQSMPAMTEDSIDNFDFMTENEMNIAPEVSSIDNSSDSIETPVNPEPSSDFGSFSDSPSFDSEKKDEF